jgi:hypothetical protein
MSTPSGDSLRQEIVENALVVGNPVKDASKIALINANSVYVDANGVMAAVPPMPITVTSAQATTTALMNLSGASTLSATGPLTNTLVVGSAVTTATIAGYARVTITDSAGNVTTSQYYVPFYTLA